MKIGVMKVGEWLNDFLFFLHLRKGYVVSKLDAYQFTGGERFGTGLLTDDVAFTLVGVRWRRNDRFIFRDCVRQVDGNSGRSRYWLHFSRKQDAAMFLLVHGGSLVVLEWRPWKIADKIFILIFYTLNCFNIASFAFRILQRVFQR